MISQAKTQIPKQHKFAKKRQAVTRLPFEASQHHLLIYVDCDNLGRRLVGTAIVGAAIISQRNGQRRCSNVCSTLEGEEQVAIGQNDLWLRVEHGIRRSRDRVA